jgi:TrmH family RNA methyltransferase
MLSEISSKENPNYKRLKKTAVDKEIFIFIEGKKLLEEALKSNLNIKEVFVDKDNYNNLSEELKNKNDCQITFMNNSLIASAFTTENIPAESELIVALAEKPEWNLNDILKSRKDIVLLESIQDPGNLGSIIRSSSGFNIGGVILLLDSVYPFNTKVIRASAGAVFNVPVVSVSDFNDFYKTVKSQNYKFLSTSSKSGIEPEKAPKNQLYIFMFGNEGRGLSEELIKIGDECIKIPHLSSIESLNLSVAASIILWEFYRR